MNTNYMNPQYTSGITTNDLDRRYAGDFVRDFWNQREYDGTIINALLGTTNNVILSGGVVTQGSGNTLNITACKGISKYSVKVPSSWGSIPPVTSNVDIPIYVESTAQTNLAIPNAVTDNVTLNYVKLQYVESLTNNRVKADDPLSTSYFSEVIPSFQFVVDSVANSTYDILLTTFITNGTTHTFYNTNSTIITPITTINTEITTGWNPANETWTYASADPPTFTFTIPGDVTGKYSAGMKIKLTQTTVKYFIISIPPVYGAPNTTITCYGGTDYSLTSGAITLNYYSTQKSPYGFPMNSTKWTVELLSSTQRLTNSPTQNTWYNAESLTVPIGLWNVIYYASIEALNSAVVRAFVTLSTANNTESDIYFTNYFEAYINLGNNSSINKILSLGAKTTYYLNYRTTTASVTNIAILADIAPTIIRAICAYL